ncbi:MAG: DUF86 domain-containing protein, partial [Candidatus Aenigmatarchaeota archaeon]
MSLEIIKLLRELEKRLKQWKEDEKIGIESFLSDQKIQNSICYNMMVSIQSAIDLGALIIEKRNLRIASTYAEIFQILAENKIIEKKIGRELEYLAKFRNALAHIYWNIDLKKVYVTLKTKRKVLEQFLKIAKKEFKINENKRKLNLIIALISIILFISQAFAAVQSHPASQITPGIFGEAILPLGNYTFPLSLYVNQNLLVSEAIGIATSSLTHKLNVNGSLRLIPIASTPPEENGTIFYNASSNKFMCFEAGEWKECLKGNINGSGIANYIPIWVSAQTLGNSIIYQSSEGIGIGTTTPLGTLSIAGTNGQLVLSASSDGGDFNIFTNASGTLAIYGANANTLNLRLLDGNLIVDSGSVGIGTTSPTTKLHVNGSLRVDNSTGSAILFVNGTSGNVGIGTTTPINKLQVIGDINASGYIYATT